MCAVTLDLEEGKYTEFFPAVVYPQVKLSQLPAAADYNKLSQVKGDSDKHVTERAS